jgi:hypothetical protein
MTADAEARPSVSEGVSPAVVRRRPIADETATVPVRIDGAEARSSIGLPWAT